MVASPGGIEPASPGGCAAAAGAPDVAAVGPDGADEPPHPTRLIKHRLDENRTVEASAPARFMTALELVWKRSIVIEDRRPRAAYVFSSNSSAG